MTCTHQKQFWHAYPKRILSDGDPPGYCCACAMEGSTLRIHELLCELSAMAGQVVQLQSALQEIKAKSGRVCADYALCTHEVCRSSHAAWEIADAALKAQEGEG